MKTYAHSWQYLAQFLEWERFRTNFVEKTKTNILHTITFPENRIVYEIMWKDKVESDRPLTTIQYGSWALHAG